MHEHETDEALLVRLRAGDGSAFEVVVRTYQGDLYRLAYRFTRNMEDAKDLAQQAFLRAYRALPRFDGRSSLYTWLYRITLNLCLNHRRGKPREEKANFFHAVRNLRARLRGYGAGGGCAAMRSRPS